MPPSVHPKAKRIFSMHEWISESKIPRDVDQPASLEHIATMDALDLGLAVHAARTDPPKLKRTREVLKKLRQLSQDAGNTPDTPWQQAADIISAALEDDQFRAALELHLQLENASPVSDFVWVALVKASEGSLTKLHLRMVKSATTVCLPHPRHFDHSQNHKEERALHQTMARLFSIVTDRHPHGFHACQWEVANERDVTGNSFTAAAVHGWQRMLQGGCADRNVLIMAELDPEADALVPVKGIKQKVEALLRHPHAHGIDKLVVAHDNAQEVCDALDKAHATKRYVLELL